MKILMKLIGLCLIVNINIECLKKLYKNRGKKSILCPFCRNVIEKPINTKEIHNMSFIEDFI